MQDALLVDGIRKKHIALANDLDERGWPGISRLVERSFDSVRNRNSFDGHTLSQTGKFFSSSVRFTRRADECRQRDSGQYRLPRHTIFGRDRGG